MALFSFLPLIPLFLLAGFFHGQHFQRNDNDDTNSHARLGQFAPGVGRLRDNDFYYCFSPGLESTIVHRQCSYKTNLKIVNLPGDVGRFQIIDAATGYCATIGRNENTEPEPGTILYFRVCVNGRNQIFVKGDKSNADRNFVQLRRNWEGSYPLCITGNGGNEMSAYLTAEICKEKHFAHLQFWQFERNFS